MTRIQETSKILVEEIEKIKDSSYNLSNTINNFYNFLLDNFESISPIQDMVSIIKSLSEISLAETDCECDNEEIQKVKDLVIRAREIINI
jgi:hypothetical protein